MNSSIASAYTVFYIVWLERIEILSNYQGLDVTKASFFEQKLEVIFMVLFQHNFERSLKLQDRCQSDAGDLKQNILHFSYRRRKIP